MKKIKILLLSLLPVLSFAQGKIPLKQGGLFGSTDASLTSGGTINDANISGLIKTVSFIHGLSTDILGRQYKVSDAGKSGIFTCVSLTSSGFTDDGIFTLITSGGQVFQREYDETIYAEWAGAGQTSNDQTAFLAMVAALNSRSGGTIQLKSNTTYHFNNALGLSGVMIFNKPIHLQGGVNTKIQFNNIDYPQIITHYAYSAVSDITFEYTGVTKYNYPGGPASAIRAALGYADMPAMNNFETSTVILETGSDYFRFENLKFQSATPDHGHEMAFCISLFGKDSGQNTNYGLISNVDFRDYETGIIAAGVDYLTVKDIRSSWRSRNFNLPPGHVLYTLSNLSNTRPNRPNRYVRFTGLTEGGSYHDSVDIGPVSVKHCDSSYFSTFNVEYPSGLLHSIDSTNNTTFENMTWHGGKFETTVPIINIPNTNGKNNLIFKNITMDNDTFFSTFVQYSGATASIVNNNVWENITGRGASYSPILYAAATQPYAFISRGTGMYWSNIKYIPTSNYVGQVDTTKFFLSDAGSSETSLDGDVTGIYADSLTYRTSGTISGSGYLNVRIKSRPVTPLDLTTDQTVTFGLKTFAQTFTDVALFGRSVYFNQTYSQAANNGVGVQLQLNGTLTTNGFTGGNLYSIMHKFPIVPDATNSRTIGVPTLAYQVVYANQINSPSNAGIWRIPAAGSAKIDFAGSATISTYSSNHTNFGYNVADRKAIVNVNRIDNTSIFENIHLDGNIVNFTKTNVEPGGIARDSIAGALYYNEGGTVFNLLNPQSLTMARATVSGNGSATSFALPHGLTGITTTSKVQITANVAAAAGFTYATIDATNVTIFYSAAPASGTNNLTWTIEIIP